MFVAAKQTQEPEGEQSQQAQATGKPSSAEDEAVKRNTDCVYFLASPLTCKKGSECEYRHSEYARVNPRDCYFWLNGNCLNPKCAFRHPPLDGFLGTQAVTPGSSLPPPLPSSQALAAPVPTAPYTGKQAVPCIYFQKGYCLRGDRCAFLHGPSPTSTYKGQGASGVSGPELPNHKKISGGLQKCTQEKMPVDGITKSIETVPSGNGIIAGVNSKPAPSEVAPPRNGVASGKGSQQHVGIERDNQRHKPLSISPVMNGGSTIGSNRLYQNQVSDNQSIQNIKDVDECLRESSPGFDVLVDDELGDPDYYHSEDQYGRARGPEGRNFNSEGEYDPGRSADYRDADREMFSEAHHYDSYDMTGRAVWEDERTSSERRFLRPSNHDRRKHPISESADLIDESDLRYRLSKHRRLNDLRSIVSHDFLPEHEEQSYQSSRRESSHVPVRESSLSSRLRGRIKLPGRASSGDGIETNSDRDIGRGSDWGRSSSARGLQISQHHSRLSDRIKGRVQEDIEYDGRSFRGPRMRREIMDDKRGDFAGPKSLAELKNKGRQTRDHQNIEDHQRSEHDLSFEGPKPLSEILKRKRGSETSGAGSIMQSENKGIGIKSRGEQCPEGSIKNPAVTEKQCPLSYVSEDGADNQVPKSKEESKSLPSDMVGSAEEKTDIAHGQSSQVERQIGTEDGTIAEEAMEDREYDAGDQREEEYYYEEGEEGDYNYDEGEYIEGEEEYLQDEDDDEFAKKIGVISS